MSLSGCDFLHSLGLLLGDSVSSSSLLLSGLVSSGLSLGLQSLLADLLGLGLVNVVHQHTLVLEFVTLAFKVQIVIKVLIDLGRLAVLAEQAAEHSHAADPDHLGGEAGLAGTLSLTGAGVATLGLGLIALVNAGAGVNSVGLADNITILNQAANVLA